MSNADILTPAEARHTLGVTAETLANWANQGRISYFRTPAGHRRYSRAQLRALVAASNTDRTPETQETS